MGYNDEEPELRCIWRIVPTGQFFKCDMAAIGHAAHIAESYLIRFCLHQMLGISKRITISNMKMNQKFPCKRLLTKNIQSTQTCKRLQFTLDYSGPEISLQMHINNSIKTNVSSNIFYRRISPAKKICS